MKRLNNSSPDGVHYLLEFFGCTNEQTDSISFWKRILTKAIEDSDVSILNEHFYKFAPHGITGYLLLSASHVSIHTWPEFGYAACDVFSCGGDAETKAIVKHITMELQHEKIKTRKLKRGFKVPTGEGHTGSRPTQA